MTPFNSLISSLCKLLNLLFGFSSPLNTDRRCRDREWSKFFWSVTYSRFSKQLLDLLKSIWLTSNSLGPIKASITSLWTAFNFSCLFPYNFTRKYPPVTALSTRMVSLFRFKDLTRPKLLTKYLSSYPGIGFHISIGVLFILIFGGCATVQVPELRPGITLPASGDGLQVDTITGATTRIPADQWKKKLPKGIILFSDDWKILKTTLLTNCMQNTCSQAVGVLDSLFQTVDQALQKLPSPGGN